MFELQSALRKYLEIASFLKFVIPMAVKRARAFISAGVGQRDPALIRGNAKNDRLYH
jgi:hypothetical protein